MSDLGLVLQQAKYELKATSRNPRAMVFTFALPIALLVIFNSVLSKHQNPSVPLTGGLRVGAMSYFTAGLIAYSMALACFTALLMSLTAQRESGQLKRYRGTPMPPWTFVAGLVLRSIVQVGAMVIVLLVVGHFAYNVHVPSNTVPALIIYVLLGTAAFTVLGIALTAITPTPEAAAAIGPFSIVILSFVSGVFIRTDQIPNAAVQVGKVFPLAHLSQGLQISLAPHASGVGLNANDVVVLLVWAAVGLVVAARRFRWEPQMAG